MDLAHYTRNFDTATSIIKSGQIWLSKLNRMKDQEEIIHYMKGFKQVHYFKELGNLLDNQRQLIRSNIFDFEKCMMQIYAFKSNWNEQVTYADLFIDISREHSYLSCFTENLNSEFHFKEYGDVAFIFKNEPFNSKSIKNFNLLNDKIHYFDADYFTELYKDVKFVSSIAKVSPTLSAKKIYFETLNNHSREVKNKISLLNDVFVLKTLQNLEKMNFHKNTDQDFIKVMAKEMKNRRENYFKEMAKDLALDKHTKPEKITRDFLNTVEKNFISFFMKDNGNHDDQETRYIAFPKNERGISENDVLKVALKKQNLIKIKINPNSKVNHGQIEDLKKLLIDNGFYNCSIE